MDKGYIAGIFDGEGCVGVYDRNSDRSGKIRYYVLVVSISQGGEFGRELLLKIKEQYGGSLSHKKGSNKPMWQLNFSPTAGMLFLEAVSELLFIKKEQAQLAISFQKKKNKHTSDQENQKIADRLRYLKTI